MKRIISTFVSMCMIAAVLTLFVPMSAVSADGAEKTENIMVGEDIQTNAEGTEEISEAEEIFDETTAETADDYICFVNTSEAYMNTPRVGVSDNLTTEDTDVDYSAGTLKAGSYIGYAAEDNMGYNGIGDVIITSAGSTADGNIAYKPYASTVMSVNDAGEIVLTKGRTGTGTDEVSVAYAPTADKNGISRPANIPVFAEAKFTQSKVAANYTYVFQFNNTQAPFQFGRYGSGGTAINQSGAVSFEHRNSATATSAVFGGVSGIVDGDNSTVNVRTWHQLGGSQANNKIKVWMWNPGAPNSGARSKPVFPQLDAWGAWNTGAVDFQYINFNLHSNLAINDTLTLHYIRVVEQDEMLLRDAIIRTEGNLLGGSDDFDRVQSALTLPSQITGLDLGETASVAWTTDKPEVINIGTGVLTRPYDDDVDVVLTGVYTVGGKTKTIEYKLTVAGMPNPNVVVAEAEEKLTWAFLTEQSKDGVRQDISLPNSVSAAGTSVNAAWEIVEGNSNIVLNNIGSYTLASVTSGTADVSAKLKVTLTYEGATPVTKEFSFVILHKLIEIDYVSEDYAAQPNAILSSGVMDDITVTTASTADSKVEINNNGLRAYSANPTDAATAAANQAKAVINLDSKTDKSGLTEEYRNFESDTVYEFAVITEALSSSLTSETHLHILDEQENIFAFFQFTGANSSNGAANGTINIKINDAWLNGTGVTAVNSFITNKYRPGFSGRAFPAVKFKVIYNRVTAACAIYLKLESESDDNYVLFWDAGFTSYTNSSAAFSKGTRMAKVLITSTANASRNGAITLKDLKACTNENIILDYITDKLSEAKILNGQDKNSVLGDLKFDASLHYGTTLRFDVTSDYNGEVFSSDGKLLLDLKDREGEEYNATIKPVVTFTNSKLSGMTMPNVSYNVTLIGYSTGGLSYGKTVAVTGAVLDLSSKASYLTDGILGTSLTTTGAETAFSVVIDLGKSALLSRFVVKEEALGGVYNVNDWSIEGSNDKKTWKTLLNENGAGAAKDINLSSPYSAYRYVRLNIKNKIVPNAKVALSELKIYFDPDEAYKNSEDFKSVQAPPRSVSADFYLQGAGTVYGKDVVWVSGDSSVLEISNARDGNNGYKVTYTKPSANKYVTLRMSVGNNSENYSVLVLSGSSSGGGGGSAGGTAGSGGGGMVSYGSQPTDLSGDDNVQNNVESGSGGGSKYFTDLTDAAWAAEYVDVLHEKGIVSGDDAGNFKPNNRITREEYTKILILALGIKPVYGTELPFADISRDSWAYPYVAGAYISGIINGISENTFGMGSEILRQDMSVMTLRALTIANRTMELKPNDKDFMDRDEIDGYALESVEMMKRYGVFSGDDVGRFNPKNTATRAESAKVLYSIIMD